MIDFRVGYCRKHPHSSDLTSRQCFNKTHRKRADRILQGADPVEICMVGYSPPREVLKGNLIIYVFRENILDKIKLS